MVRETRHLWVGNLPDNIREDRIREHFKRYGRVQNVKLLGRTENPSAVTSGTASSGFCATVAFMDIKSASKAHNAEHVLDERTLTTEYYEPTAIPSVAGAPSAGSSPAGSGYSGSSSSVNSAPATTTSVSRYHLSGGEDSATAQCVIAATAAAPVTWRGTNDSATEFCRRGSTPATYGRYQRNNSTSAPYATPPSNTERCGGSGGGGGTTRWYGGSGGGGESTPSTPGGAEPARRRRRSGSGSSRSDSSSPDASDASRASTPQAPPPTQPSANHRTPTSSHHQWSSSTASGRPLAICVRNLPTRSTDSSLKDGLYHEYKKHGKVVWVKIVGQNADRYAVVRFKKPSDVEKALEVSQDKLFFGCKISVAPHQSCDDDADSVKPYETDIDEYHPKATRTLFIGNLEKDVTQQQIRDKFKHFGRIIEVDIKKGSGGGAGYAFCQYASISSVVDAIRAMDGEYVGGARVKLGFGKPVATTCVWVDGLTEHTEKQVLGAVGRCGTALSVCVDRAAGAALVHFEQAAAAGACVRELRRVAASTASAEPAHPRLTVDYASRECQEAFYEQLEKHGGGTTTTTPGDRATDARLPRLDTLRYEGGSRSRASSYGRGASRTPRYGTLEHYDSGDYSERRYRVYEELGSSPATEDIAYEERLQSVVVSPQRARRHRRDSTPDDRKLSKERHRSGARRSRSGSMCGSRHGRRRHRRRHESGSPRAGTPLRDEPDAAPAEPRRPPRERPPLPMCLPLPKFAAQLLRQRPPTPRPAPDSPPRPPSAASSSSGSAPHSPSLEERIRSLDEKYERWSGSRAANEAPDRARLRHRLLDVDIHEVKPSDVVRSLLAKRSVFDEDSERLEGCPRAAAAAAAAAAALDPRRDPARRRRQPDHADQALAADARPHVDEPFRLSTLKAFDDPSRLLTVKSLDEPPRMTTSKSFDEPARTPTSKSFDEPSKLTISKSFDDLPRTPSQKVLDEPLRQTRLHEDPSRTQSQKTDEQSRSVESRSTSQRLLDEIPKSSTQKTPEDSSRLGNVDELSRSTGQRTLDDTNRASSQRIQDDLSKIQRQRMPDESSSKLSRPRTPEKSVRSSRQRSPDEPSKISSQKSTEESSKVLCPRIPTELNKVVRPNTPEDPPKSTRQRSPEALPKSTRQKTPEEQPKSTRQRTPEEQPKSTRPRTPEELPKTTRQWTPEEVAKSTRQSTEEQPKCPRQKIPDEEQKSIRQKSPEELPKSMRQRTPEELPKSTRQVTPEELPKSTRQKTPEELPKSTRQRTPEELPKSTRQRTPEELPHSTRQRTPEEIPRPTNQISVDDQMRCPSQKIFDEISKTSQNFSDETSRNSNQKVSEDTVRSSRLLESTTSLKTTDGSSRLINHRILDEPHRPSRIIEEPSRPSSRRPSDELHRASSRVTEEISRPTKEESSDLTPIQRKADDTAKSSIQRFTDEISRFKTSETSRSFSHRLSEEVHASSLKLLDGRRLSVELIPLPTSSRLNSIKTEEKESEPPQKSSNENIPRIETKQEIKVESEPIVKTEKKSNHRRSDSTEFKQRGDYESKTSHSKTLIKQEKDAKINHENFCNHISKDFIKSEEIYNHSEVVIGKSCNDFLNMNHDSTKTAKPKCEESTKSIIMSNIKEEKDDLDYEKPSVKNNQINNSITLSSNKILLDMEKSIDDRIRHDRERSFDERSKNDRERTKHSKDRNDRDKTEKDRHEHQHKHDDKMKTSKHDKSVDRHEREKRSKDEHSVDRSRSEKDSDKSHKEKHDADKAKHCEEKSKYEVHRKDKTEKDKKKENGEFDKSKKDDKHKHERSKKESTDNKRDKKEGEGSKSRKSSRDETVKELNRKDSTDSSASRTSHDSSKVKDLENIEPKEEVRLKIIPIDLFQKIETEKEQSKSKNKVESKDERSSEQQQLKIKNENTDVSHKNRSDVSEKQRHHSLDSPQVDAKRKERLNSSSSLPSHIGHKRRMSSQDSLESVSEHTKKSRNESKIPERRESKDSRNNDRHKVPKFSKGHFAKLLESKTKDEKKNQVKPPDDSFIELKNCDVKDQKFFEKCKPPKKTIKEEFDERNSQLLSSSAPQVSQNDLDFLATLELRSSEEDEKQKALRKDMKEKKRIQQLQQIQELQMQQDAMHQAELHNKTKDDKKPKVDDKKKEMAREKRMSTDRKSREEKIEHKRKNSKKQSGSTDSSDTDEPKKHSIFDIVDDGPTYISMYDKVKARSCKNMQKQEEEKRQEKIKAKFSQLKQSRAKREEKKRSSWDEDSDSETDQRMHHKTSVESSTEDEDMHNKNRDKPHRSSEFRRSKASGYATNEEDACNKLSRKNSRTRIMSDSSDDDASKRSITPSFLNDHKKDLSDFETIAKKRDEDTPPIKTFIDDKIKKNSLLNLFGKSDSDDSRLKSSIETDTDYNTHFNKLNNHDLSSESESMPSRRNSSDTRKKHKKKQKKYKFSLSDDETRTETSEPTMNDGKHKHDKIRRSSSKKEKRREKVHESSMSNLHEDKSHFKKDKISPVSSSYEQTTESALKKEGKMEDIFGPISDESDRETRRIHAKNEFQNHEYDLTFSTSTDICFIPASEDNKLKDKEDNRRKKEKRRKERKHFFREDDNSLDVDAVSKAIEARLFAETVDSLSKHEKSEHRHGKHDDSNSLEFSKMSKYNDKVKEKKKKKKRSKEDKQSRKDHHHSHHREQQMSKSENQTIDDWNLGLSPKSLILEDIPLPTEPHVVHLSDKSDDCKSLSESPSLPRLVESPPIVIQSDSQNTDIKDMDSDTTSQIIIDESDDTDLTRKTDTEDVPTPYSLENFVPDISEVPLPDGPMPEKVGENRHKPEVNSFDMDCNENAVRSITNLQDDEDKTKPPEKQDSPKIEKKAEEKPRAVISQEETEDAVAALLGESFGGKDSSFDTCFEEIENSPTIQTDSENTTVENENIPEEDAEEMRRAVQNLNACEMEMKPDTPVSDSDLLLIDTDSEETDESPSELSEKLPGNNVITTSQVQTSTAEVSKPIEVKNIIVAKPKTTIIQPVTSEPPVSLSVNTPNLEKPNLDTKVPVPQKEPVQYITSTATPVITSWTLTSNNKMIEPHILNIQTNQLAHRESHETKPGHITANIVQIKAPTKPNVRPIITPYRVTAPYQVLNHMMRPQSSSMQPPTIKIPESHILYQKPGIVISPRLSSPKPSEPLTSPRLAILTSSPQGGAPRSPGGGGGAGGAGGAGGGQVTVVRMPLSPLRPASVLVQAPADAALHYARLPAKPDQHDDAAKIMLSPPGLSRTTNPTVMAQNRLISMQNSVNLGNIHLAGNKVLINKIPLAEKRDVQVQKSDHVPFAPAPIIHVTGVASSSGSIIHTAGKSIMCSLQDGSSPMRGTSPNVIHALNAQRLITATPLSNILQIDTNKTPPSVLSMATMRSPTVLTKLESCTSVTTPSLTNVVMTPLLLKTSNSPATIRIKPKNLAEKMEEASIQKDFIEHLEKPADFKDDVKLKSEPKEELNIKPVQTPLTPAQEHKIKCETDFEELLKDTTNEIKVTNDPDKKLEINVGKTVTVLTNHEIKPSMESLKKEHPPEATTPVSTSFITTNPQTFTPLKKESLTAERTENILHNIDLVSKAQKEHKPLVSTSFITANPQTFTQVKKESFTAERTENTLHNIDLVTKVQKEHSKPSVSTSFITANPQTVTQVKKESFTTERTENIRHNIELATMQSEKETSKIENKLEIHLQTDTKLPLKTDENEPKLTDIMPLLKDINSLAEDKLKSLDEDSWSAKDINIESVIKKVDSLCNDNNDIVECKEEKPKVILTEERRSSITQSQATSFIDFSENSPMDVEAENVNCSFDGFGVIKTTGQNINTTTSKRGGRSTRGKRSEKKQDRVQTRQIAKPARGTTGRRGRGRAKLDKKIKNVSENSHNIPGDVYDFHEDSGDESSKTEARPRLILTIKSPLSGQSNVVASSILSIAQKEKLEKSTAACKDEKVEDFVSPSTNTRKSRRLQEKDVQKTVLDDSDEGKPPPRGLGRRRSTRGGARGASDKSSSGSDTRKSPRGVKRSRDRSTSDAEPDSGEERPAKPDDAVKDAKLPKLDEPPPPVASVAPVATAEPRLEPQLASPNPVTALTKPVAALPKPVVLPPAPAPVAAVPAPAPAPAPAPVVVTPPQPSSTPIMKPPKKMISEISAKLASAAAAGAAAGAEAAGASDAADARVHSPALPHRPPSAHRLADRATPLLIRGAETEPVARAPYAATASLPRGAHQPHAHKQVAVVGPHHHHPGAASRVTITSVPAISPQGQMALGDGMYPHFSHQHYQMYQQHFRATQHETRATPSPYTRALEAEGSEAPPPPLELRRPPPSARVPRPAHSPAPADRLIMYAVGCGRSPPPAHGLARGALPPSAAPGPPHASQVPREADSLHSLLTRYPVMWQGLLALKNDAAAVQMHFVGGNPRVAGDTLPRHTDGSTPPLRIAQRMRLEPPQLEQVQRKMKLEHEHCILLALPCGRDHMDVLQQSKNLSHGFITYLQRKQAAGIVNVAPPGHHQAMYTVHIFPTCEFSNENLNRFAPDLMHRVADIAHLLIVIATV